MSLTSKSLHMDADTFHFLRQVKKYAVFTHKQQKKSMSKIIQ
jgi:hypothetical protein